MNREIKFRMWNPVPKKYHYDIDIVMECLKQQMSGIYDHEKEYGAAFEQYTGLKDKNGVEIYEGDIVKHMDAFGVRNGLVKWDDYTRTQLIISFEKTALHGDHNIFEQSEVIGNIYQTPELLEGVQG